MSTQHRLFASMVKLASVVAEADKPATNAATGAAPALRPSRRLGQGQPGVLRRKLNSDYEAWKQDQLKKTASWSATVQSSQPASPVRF